MSLDKQLGKLLNKIFGDMDNTARVAILSLLTIGLMTLTLPVIVAFLWILGVL